MGHNAFWSLYRERCGSGHRLVEGDHFPDAIPLNGVLNGQFICDLSRFDEILLDQHSTAAKQFVVHHLAGDDGDEDLVPTDHVVLHGLGTREVIGDRAIDFRYVHRVDELGVAFFVPFTDIVMAGRGRHTQPFRDRQIGVLERETELRAFKSGGLVRLVKNAEVKAFVPSHSLGNHACRLVGGKDHFHSVGCPFKK